jgi:hypothetical protein
MSGGILTFRDRALLHNARRDIEEIAIDKMWLIRPEGAGVKTKIVSNNGEMRLMVDVEAPRYLNMVDVLLLIRRLISMALLMDEAKMLQNLKLHYLERIMEDNE